MHSREAQGSAGHLANDREPKVEVSGNLGRIALVSRLSRRLASYCQLTGGESEFTGAVGDMLWYTGTSLRESEPRRGLITSDFEEIH
jgi:hypothetical protein